MPAGYEVPVPFRERSDRVAYPQGTLSLLYTVLSCSLIGEESPNEKGKNLYRN